MQHVVVSINTGYYTAGTVILTLHVIGSDLNYQPVIPSLHRPYLNYPQYYKKQ